MSNIADANPVYNTPAATLRELIQQLAAAAAKQAAVEPCERTEAMASAVRLGCAVEVKLVVTIKYAP